jgi:hypothetical protein
MASFVMPNFHGAFSSCTKCTAKCLKIPKQQNVSLSTIGERSSLIQAYLSGEKRRKEERNRKLNSEVSRSRTFSEIDEKDLPQSVQRSNDDEITAERSPVNPVSESISRITRFLKRTRFSEDAATVLRFLSISVGDRPDS